jgi:hypothetical protein
MNYTRLKFEPKYFHDSLIVTPSTFSSGLNPDQICVKLSVLGKQNAGHFTL